MMKTKSAVVLGAGVIGLTTGMRLIEAGWRVTIVAREETPHTTSDVAAAFWYPYKVESSARVASWAAVTHRAYANLQERGAPGLRTVPLWLLQRTEQPPLVLPTGIDGSPVTAAELPVGFAQGRQVDVVRIDTPIFMPWLHADFLRSGGEVRRRTVTRVDDLLAESALVVNCSGVGARSVTPDDSVYPIRGQVVRVARPAGLPHTILVHEDDETTTYIVPRQHDCILGGTGEIGNADLTPNAATASAILERCHALEPRLAGAAVLEDRVGLRPGRREVRLELEPRPRGAAILHHYGHGGAGFTLAWGAADAAVALAENWAMDQAQGNSS